MLSRVPWAGQQWSLLRAWILRGSRGHPLLPMGPRLVWVFTGQAVSLRRTSEASLLLHGGFDPR